LIKREWLTLTWGLSIAYWEESGAVTSFLWEWFPFEQAVILKNRYEKSKKASFENQNNLYGRNINNKQKSGVFSDIICLLLIGYVHIN
jgi:hypothetical protein